MGKKAIDFSQNKTTRSRLKSALGFLLLATTLNLTASAQEYIDLNIGDLSRNHRIESDETKFFRLKVDQRDYDKEKDLIVKVYSENNYQGDPDVYISRVSQKHL
jgi:hypothetical protein